MEHLPEQQHMEGEGAAKLRRLERSCGLNGGSSFHLEDLPMEIQPLVLSLLSLKEAASTSIVSRNWRKLWTWYPNLCFDGSRDGPADKYGLKIETEKFIETVDSIIRQHSGIGLNKFGIRCNLRKNSSDVLDRWICFATESKAKVIDMNLGPKRNNVGPSKHAYGFPLEAFGAQDCPFIHSLSLNNVSIKPHLDICGFTKLRFLHLDCVQIIGDLPGLLLNCCSLEDLEVIACLGVTCLNIPHQLDKLRHLLISDTRVQMIELNAPRLSDFGYQGEVIPIVLHGCSKLQKATLNFHHTWNEEEHNKVLGHAFNGIPSISTVKVLNVRAYTHIKQPVWSSQVHTLIRPTCMFMNLRHLNYEIAIFTNFPNSYDGILRMAQYLALVPQLETLELHMFYARNDSSCWHGEVVSFPMRGLDRLKMVYMSGFRCYRAQMDLLCGILQMAAALEHVTIDPIARVQFRSAHATLFIPDENKICEWAHGASERFVCGILQMGAVLQHVTIDPIARVQFRSAYAGLFIPDEDKICEWAHGASERFGKAINVIKPL
ncbi:hypothetical protein U9M48_040959 [Paspalum notatum var. saurae]|uniref:F-box domain-containing protein n=1 Tax=Paspalum notatum var. saurae TaxID=547442 RepID=A0AAQ3UMS3_PASNO